MVNSIELITIKRSIRWFKDLEDLKDFKFLQELLSCCTAIASAFAQRAKEPGDPLTRLSDQLSARVKETFE
ncbi:MAG TPA: hypothetical protein VFG54_10955 [Prolixibacteraceae bacterium]|nr:hypothetical protein [Prolixibacteraceae bacterium]